MKKLTDASTKLWWKNGLETWCSVEQNVVKIQKTHNGMTGCVPSVTFFALPLCKCFWKYKKITRCWLLPAVFNGVLHYLCSRVSLFLLFFFTLHLFVLLQFSKEAVSGCKVVEVPFSIALNLRLDLYLDLVPSSHSSISVLFGNVLKSSRDC